MPSDRGSTGLAEPSNRPHVFGPALIVLTLLAGALRFFALDSRDFWFDESCTFFYVHQLLSGSVGLDFLIESTNLPYYLCLLPWTSIFGDSEAAYRSFSALAATLTVPLLGLVGRRLGGTSAGLLCAAFVALNPLHIFYAHEARAYALWVFLLSVALYCLCRAAQCMSRGWWGAYCLAMFICLPLHYYTLYWVPCTLICLVLAPRPRVVFRQWLMATAIVGLVFLPYFLAAVLPAAQEGGRAWLGGSWDPIRALPKTLWAFFPAGGYPAHLRGLSMLSPDTVAIGPAWLVSVSKTLPAVVVMSAFAVCVLSGYRKLLTGVGSLGRGSFVFASGVAFGPLMLAWLSSCLLEPNYFPGRYDLVAFPGWSIWLALVFMHFAGCLEGKRRRWVVGAACGALALCSMVPTARFLALKPPTSFHRARAQRMAALTESNDVVLTLSYDRYYLNYYLHRYGFRGEVASYPSWLDRQVGWLDTAADIAPGRRSELVADADTRVEMIESALGDGRRVFFLADSSDPQGGGPRRVIAETLHQCLDARAIRGSVIDETFMIAELSQPVGPRGLKPAAR